MMETDLLIIYLRKKSESILSVQEVLPNTIELYIFGSASKGSSFKDVDILFLYSREHYCLKAIAQIKNEVRRGIEEELDIRIDLVALSFDEDNLSGFSKSENALKFFGN